MRINRRIVVYVRSLKVIKWLNFAQCSASPKVETTNMIIKCLLHIHNTYLEKFFNSKFEIYA